MRFTTVADAIVNSSRRRENRVWFAAAPLSRGTPAARALMRLSKSGGRSTRSALVQKKRDGNIGIAKWLNTALSKNIRLAPWMRIDCVRTRGRSRRNAVTRVSPIEGHGPKRRRLSHIVKAFSAAGSAKRGSLMMEESRAFG